MKTKEQIQILLGENIRNIRTSRNWSVEKLALESGLTYSQISRIELGRRNPTVYTLYQIIFTLEVQASEVLKQQEIL